MATRSIFLLMIRELLPVLVKRSKNIKARPSLSSMAMGRSHSQLSVNTHTHAAMTLLRGYADDMILQDWLTQKIWPLEAHLTNKDVYHGTRLACIEMIRSGTTAFNDMYFFMDDAARRWTNPVFVQCFRTGLSTSSLRRNARRSAKRQRALVHI